MDRILGTATVRGCRRTTKVTLEVDGMQGVRGSNPLSSTPIAAASARVACVYAPRATWDDWMRSVVRALAGVTRRRSGRRMWTLQKRVIGRREPEFAVETVRISGVQEPPEAGPRPLVNHDVDQPLTES